MKVIAIIPARGGSKGIPRKNVLSLAGKPLIAHTIEAALASRHVGRTIVSTDDAEIAEVSKTFGAEVIWRPEEISGKNASSEQALLHALDCCRQTENLFPDILVFLQCTSPLTIPEDIDGTVDLLLQKDADTALCVAPFHYFLWELDESGQAIGINHNKNCRVLRQKQKKQQFLETGSVYVMRVKGFLANRHRFFGRTVFHVIPTNRCLEIDDPIDFQIASDLMQSRQAHQRAQALPGQVAALVCDFDGVFTNNRVIVLEDGREAVLCSRSDGWAISELQRRGIPILVLSGEKNPVVRKRCEKLGIECHHGIQAKAELLRQWLQKRHIDAKSVIYIGNDVADIECMEMVGCSIGVADAHRQVKIAARIVLTSAGGRDALRELVELITERVEG